MRIAVKPHAITGLKTLHGPGQVHLGRGHHQMVVLGHHGVSQDLEGETFAQFEDRFQPMLVIPVSAENNPAFSATACDMVPGVGP